MLAPIKNRIIAYGSCLEVYVIFLRLYQNQQIKPYDFIKLVVHWSLVPITNHGIQLCLFILIVFDLF